MTEAGTPWLSQSEPPRLQPDLVLLSLDQETLAFSDSTQSLLHLTPAAALLVDKLQDRSSVTDLIEWLTADDTMTPHEAEQWLAARLSDLAAHGILAGAPSRHLASPAIREEDEAAIRRAKACQPYTAFEPVAERCYRLLGIQALIRFGHAAQFRLVESVIGHLAQTGPADPDIRIELAAKKLADGHVRSDVYRDSLPYDHAPILSMLGPIVKAAVWEAAINAHDFRFYIHAGVVGSGQTCILLPAAAGSGKSSLTVALVNRGFDYFSDEVALIEPATFLVPPMPLAMCVKSTGWDLMERYYPALASLPTHQRGDRKLVHYIPPPPGSAEHRARPVSHIIFPRYVPDAPTRLEPMKRCDALGRLMGECLALRRRLDQ